MAFFEACALHRPCLHRLGTSHGNQSSHGLGKFSLGHKSYHRVDGPFYKTTRGRMCFEKSPAATRYCAVSCMHVNR